MTTFSRAPADGSEVVFTFPGQGSCSWPLLGEIYRQHPWSHSRFERADLTARRFLGSPLLGLVTSESESERAALLAAFPDLDQLGIFTAEVLIAEILERRGLLPQLLLGHSFGDLAALAVAGVYGFDTGLKIVCQRVLTLADDVALGRMAAVSCSPERAADVLASAPTHHVELAVINAPKQCVLSGPADELEDLAPRFNRRGVSLTRLASRYPFHSSHLQRSAHAFETCLRSYDYRPPRVPVTLCTEEGALYVPAHDLPRVLSSQLTTRLDFRHLIAQVLDAGYQRFVECGSGQVVGKIVAKNVVSDRQISIRAVAARGRDLDQGVEETVSAVVAAGLALSDSSRDTRLWGWMEGRGGASGSDPAAETSTNAEPMVAPAASPASLEEPPCPSEPIAIISIGCVLPGGASDPQKYWQNILEGVSGIVDLAELDPAAAADFLEPPLAGEIRIVPDKTYTLLNGSVIEIDYDSELLAASYDRDGFERLTRGQRLLALALGQTLTGLANGVPDSDLAAECILGSTADGSSEYDDALFKESLLRQVARLEESPEVRRRLADRIEGLMAGVGPAADLEQHRILQEVCDRLLPAGVRSYVVDSACSSSLYSLNLAMKALETHRADWTLAGGVFAPGPANNALFAQFRGLTPTGCRPLDAGADGVVFGEGAAIVALKRLGDALDSGDRVLGVLRGMGLSSDGKCPSINVPRAEGQVLAVERAYATSGIDPESIQCVEAHATATPVGDAEEFKSLSRVFGGRNEGRPIELGSVKALIGHTGWVSGVAALIKMVKAFEHGLVPPQFNFETPSSQIDLESSPFVISKSAHEWPANAGGLPRRAAINGFGFGGTNAHLIVEAFEPAYHRALKRADPDPRPSRFAVVGLAALFPAADSLESCRPGELRAFDRRRMRLPSKKLLLPDITDHMDPSQYLAALAAEQIFDTAPEVYLRLKDEVGVVLGLASKTERGVTANERIFLDRFERLLREQANDGSPSAETELLLELAKTIRRENMPSGPYTLPGLMPNLASGRVSSMFDLKGPNLLVDMGDNSLPQAVAVAADLLAAGDCSIALAGGVNAFSAGSDRHGEAALMMALTTPELAEREQLEVLAYMELAPASGGGKTRSDGVAGLDLRGARGAHEIVRALDGEVSTLPELEHAGAPRRRFALVFESARAREDRVGSSTAAAGANPAPPAPPSTAYAYVQETPIYPCTPRLTPAPATAASRPLRERRLLLLSDQPESWRRLVESGALDGVSYRVVCPADRPVAGGLAVDLGDNERLVATAAELAELEFDTIVALDDLSGRLPDSMLCADPAEEVSLLDLLFGVARERLASVRESRAAVVALCCDALRGELIDPRAGLLGGFLKSLARELPESTCRMIATDAADLAGALPLLAGELAQERDPVEVVYRDGARHAYELAQVDRLSTGEELLLDESSVVVATGGGRGVTAVLSEQLLRQFGCTVIGLGRTSPTAAPPELLGLSEEEFRELEGRFYQQELARDSSQKIKDLKRRYRSYQAVNELNRVIDRLSSLPGRFDYRQLDINDPDGVATFVAEVKRDHGRLDLLLHGAGVQVSTALSKKTLADFRRIVGTKLASLSHFYRACRDQFGAGATHYHLLTSAFSYLGNDGQPDYGAANEAMNRLAAVLDGEQGASWSSMAWLGWAGIGMTRGSEFAALAANRRLRGVTHEEGSEIFSELVTGRPGTPINVLLADGEVDFYRPAIAAAGLRPPARPAAPRSLVVPVHLSLEEAPYLRDHVVNGVPTMPGSMITGVAADAAHKLRPDLKIQSFEQSGFLRFVKVYEDRPTDLRIEATVVSEDAEQAVVRVRVLSDFVHKSGAVLERDVLHTKTLIRMAPRVRSRAASARAPATNGNGVRLPDPYVLDGSPVHLAGNFKCLESVTVYDDQREADYEPDRLGYPDAALRHMIPNVLMVDAFWRFGTVQPLGAHKLGVFVPRACERMDVFFDYTDFEASDLRKPLRFIGVNPTLEGELLHVDSIEAVDAEGQVMLSVEGGVCRKYGEIENAF